MQRFLKFIENSVKSVLKNLLYAKKSKRTPTVCKQKSDNIANAKKILLLRHDRMGDLLVTTPFLRILHNELPESQLYILLSTRNVVGKSCIEPYCTGIFIFHKNLWKTITLLKELKRKKFELVIDLLDNPSVTSSIFVRLLKPKFSLGFDKPNKNIYTHIVPLPNKINVHIVERIANLLIPFGLNLHNYNLSLEYPLNKNNSLSPKSGIRLGINVSGSHRQKFWGVTNFTTLISKIKEHFNFEIILFATKEYRFELERIRIATDVNVANFTKDFDEFASMIASCDLLITPDTSVVHLASCFKIPVIVFFHYINPKFGMPWLPYKTKCKYLISSKNFYSDIEPHIVFDEFCNLYKEVFL